MKLNSSKFNTDWNDKALSELGSFARGKSKHRPRNDPKLFAGGKYPLVQTGDVTGTSFVISKHTAAYNEFGLKQSKLWPKGTLCITIAANIAETALLGYPMCFPDSVVGFSADSEETSEVFMHYVFSYIRNAIQSTVSGSIQDNINIEYLTNLRFKIPSRSEQQKIGGVLSTLDAKIDLNQRINAELESLAKTIYDYWFVQFDFPDALGRPYKSSGGAMVWNDTLKREIPAGWRNVPLRNFVDCNTSSYGASNLPEQIIYLDTGNLTNNRLLASQGYDTGKDEVPSRARRIASNGDVLYSTVRPNQNHHGIIKASVKGLVVSTGFAVLTCTDPHLNGDFIYMVVRGNDVASKMQRIAESSRSSYPSIAPDDLLDLQFALPADRTQISKVCKFFDQVFLKVWANEKESRELTRLRDWLLPLLMNGQVRVA